MIHSNAHINIIYKDIQTNIEELDISFHNLKLITNQVYHISLYEQKLNLNLIISYLQLVGVFYKDYKIL